MKIIVGRRERIASKRQMLYMLGKKRDMLTTMFILFTGFSQKLPCCLTIYVKCSGKEIR